MIANTTFHGRVTTVRVAASADATMDHHGIVGRGTAKCRKGDVYSRRLGKDLATSRAIQDYGRQLEEHALSETLSRADVDSAWETIDRAAALVLDDLLGDLIR